MQFTTQQLKFKQINFGLTSPPFFFFAKKTEKKGGGGAVIIYSNGEPLALFRDGQTHTDSLELLQAILLHRVHKHSTTLVTHVRPRISNMN